jgi:integrase
LQERRLEHQEPEILTPDQMRACLEAANGERRLTSYLALGGFAGLRTEEILRQQWSDIDWAGGEIYVRQPKRVGGWRPRHVEILPALRRHLEPLALKDGGKVLPGGQRTLYLLRRVMMDKLGWLTWPNNCLRHSFKTYHAAHFQDLPRLQLQMGHAGAGMTAYVYGTPATRANAAAWWAL